MNQALVLSSEGLAWSEIPRPSIEDPHEALVRPIAVTVCDVDIRMLSGELPVLSPTVLGHEGVAEVLEAGAESGVARGDLVSVSWSIACGRCDRCAADLRTSCRAVPRGAMFGMPGQPWGGLLADVVKVPFARAMLTLLPQNLPAHAFVGLSCNLPLVCQAISPHPLSGEGESVLVVGGPGGLGLYAVAMAFALGARRVDYLDERGDKGDKGDIAAALGAEVLSSAPPRTAEYSLAVVASVEPALLLAALRALRPEGACEVVAPYLAPVELPLTELFFKGVTLRFSRHASQESTLRALELLALGRIAVDTIQGETLPWEALPEVLATPTPKPVFSRARETHV